MKIEQVKPVAHRIGYKHHFRNGSVAARRVRVLPKSTMRKQLSTIFFTIHGRQIEQQVLHPAFHQKFGCFVVQGFGFFLMHGTFQAQATELAPEARRA